MNKTKQQRDKDRQRNNALTAEYHRGVAVGQEEGGELAIEAAQELFRGGHDDAARALRRLSRQLYRNAKESWQAAKEAGEYK